MHQNLPLILSLTFSIFFFSSSSAFEDNLVLNKQSYVFGETIIISGNVIHIEGKFVGLQIINPSKSDIVLVDQFFPEKDGSFSKSYKAQGPKWNETGNYTIKFVYSDEVIEKQFDFIKAKNSETEFNQPSPKTSINNSDDLALSIKHQTNNPKFRLQGFPDPHNSPQFYFDRYEFEPEYRDWFDVAFPDYSLKEVVGYKKTHIPKFPNESFSPWYYVDRYNNEENYRDWFDSQFPARTIFDVLGYPELFFQTVPDWIKNNAKWWSSGQITDSEFLNGISYLINEKIIIIPKNYESNNPYSQIVPLWVKNTAGWWADGKINEKEFLKGIQFLIENGIIKV